jgi:hypothetical protein
MNGIIKLGKSTHKQIITSIHELSPLTDLPITNGNFLVANGSEWDVKKLQTAREALGITDVGDNLATLPSPEEITFIRINSDNTVSTLNAPDFLEAVGAIKKSDAIKYSLIFG